MKSAAENIDFLPTILSRFDMIFIVRDVRDETKDREIAKHILSIHVGYTETSSKNSNNNKMMTMMSASSRNNVESEEMADQQEELDLNSLKRYIAYCRARCGPTLSVAGAEKLRNHYVGIREQHRQRNVGDVTTIPITTR